MEEEPEMSGGGGEIKRLIGYKRGEEERERERESTAVMAKRSMEEVRMSAR